MTIAEKLRIIAENMQMVYEAGMPKNLYIRTIWFDDWHGGTDEDQLIPFEHKLGEIPQFIAIIPCDVSKLNAESLDDAGAILYEADACCDTITGVCYGKSVKRRKKGETSVGTTSIEDAVMKGISKCDTEYVYVNAVAASYKWPPISVTAYTINSDVK